MGDSWQIQRAFGTQSANSPCELIDVGWFYLCQKNQKASAPPRKDICRTVQRDCKCIWQCDASARQLCQCLNELDSGARGNSGICLWIPVPHWSQSWQQIPKPNVPVFARNTILHIYLSHPSKYRPQSWVQKKTSKIHHLKPQWRKMNLFDK